MESSSYTAGAAGAADFLAADFVEAAFTGSDFAAGAALEVFIVLAEVFAAVFTSDLAGDLAAVFVLVADLAEARSIV